MEHVPLSERLRPKKLEELIGQDHLTNSSSILFLALKNGNIPSMIFWGPPGVGKTSIAKVIAESLALDFFALSAIDAGVKEVRAVIKQAKDLARKVVLFIDEIHRFSKSQQDALLGAVEKGYISLIGATTENPSFEVNAALLSRCQVFILKPLAATHLQQIIDIALTKDKFLAPLKIKIKETNALFRLSSGDARKLLNLLELAVWSQYQLLGKEKVLNITNQVVTKVSQQTVANYDKNGEQHYDIISAMIKSVRGSDPNAALYWMARMINGGEDVKFIARRLIILAAEDIGMANPTALVIATNTFQAVQMIGYPEARIILSQCITYLATSPKSNASYLAIDKAIAAAKEHGDQPVPLHLRNAVTGLMKNEGYGKDYKYAHDFPGNFIPQDFLPEVIKGERFYEPGNNQKENQVRQFLKVRWEDYYDY